jgi:hypothetical protein
MGLTHVGLLAIPAAGFLFHKLLAIIAVQQGPEAATHKANERAARLPNLRRRRKGRLDAAAAPPPLEEPVAGGQDTIHLPAELPAPFLHPGDDEMEFYDEDDVDTLQAQEDSQAKLLEMLQQ